MIDWIRSIDIRITCSDIGDHLLGPELIFALRQVADRLEANSGPRNGKFNLIHAKHQICVEYNVSEVIDHD